MGLRIGLIVSLLPAAARADHGGMAMEEGEDSGSSFGAGVSLVAASYSTLDYIGDYEGVVPSVSWSMDRFSAGASFPLYRLQENGNQVYGPGDFVVNGQVALLQTKSVSGGVMLAALLPTGDTVMGLGMGHFMVMPMGWGAWKLDRFTLSAAGGYSRALTDMGGSHHDHGPWPLVEPMNMSELTWNAGGDVAIAHGVHVGARLSGGVPLISTGHERVVGALRLAWGDKRVDTAAELQAGFAGDPFTIRGVVETALHF